MNRPTYEQALADATANANDKWQKFCESWQKQYGVSFESMYPQSMEGEKKRCLLAAVRGVLDTQSSKEQRHQYFAEIRLDRQALGEVNRINSAYWAAHDADDYAMEQHLSSNDSSGPHLTAVQTVSESDWMRCRYEHPAEIAYLSSNRSYTHVAIVSALEAGKSYAEALDAGDASTMAHAWD